MQCIEPWTRLAQALVALAIKLVQFLRTSLQSRTNNALPVFRGTGRNRLHTAEVTGSIPVAPTMEERGVSGSR